MEIVLIMQWQTLATTTQHEAPVSQSGSNFKYSSRIRGEQRVFSGPNTNKNTIQVQMFDQIWIQILFVFITTKYKYYSSSEICLNTNIIWTATFVRIQMQNLDYSNILNTDTKTIIKQQIPNLIDQWKLHCRSPVPLTRTGNFTFALWVKFILFGFQTSTT